MCNLYRMPPRGAVERAIGKAGRRLLGAEWESTTVGPFQAGIFLVPEAGGHNLSAVAGQWGMIRPGQPTRKPEKQYQTNNARIESIAEKPTYRHAWARGQRCLIPAEWYAEPNWETGKNIWWHLRRADGAPWFLAGLWSEWTDKQTGELVANFTAITCNCDGHPLLGRLHKPDPKLSADAQDKRSLVHVDASVWGQWLTGTAEDALQLIRPSSPDVFDQTDVARTDQMLAEAGPGQSGLF